ncbi:unnamed protein product [Lactuca saligna]|uniref:Uncharacterized protein n=1 Tax=Lactuca saligna TaxID=75948 RepID=A0AA36E0Q4_LACSI|nr:unnamed protein product [Lactuca saligna]
MARKLRFFKDQMSKAGTTWSLNIFFNQYQSSSSLYSAISSDGKFSPMSLSGGEHRGYFGLLNKKWTVCHLDLVLVNSVVCHCQKVNSVPCHCQEVKKGGMPPGPRAGFSMCVHKSGLGYLVKFLTWRLKEIARQLFHQTSLELNFLSDVAVDWLAHPDQPSITFTTSNFNPLLSGEGGGGPIPFDLSLPIAKQVSQYIEGCWIQKFKESTYTFPDPSKNDDGSIGYSVLPNNTCQHAAPTFVNLMNDVILRLATHNGNMTIQTRNHPMPMTESQHLQHQDLDAFSLTIVVYLNSDFIRASFVVPIVKVTMDHRPPFLTLGRPAAF